MVLTVSFCLCIAWSYTAQAGDGECSLKLSLTKSQAKELSDKLTSLKAQVKKKLGTVPDKCPIDVSSYQDGDDYLTRLSEEQKSLIATKVPPAIVLAEKVEFKVAELWGVDIGEDAFICIVVVGSKVKSRGLVQH